MSRLGKLVSRSVAARRLGFAFYGTSRTPTPRRVKLRGRWVSLSFPDEPGYVLDIMNLWLDDEYGLHSLPTSPQTVVDVGANVGFFSLWSAHLHPHARIFAYEPNPRILPHLKSNTTAFSTIEVFACGLGATAGKARMEDQGESRLAATRQSDRGEIIIETMSQAIARCGGLVDLLKLDCEGAEWDLFQDPKSFRAVRLIRMEYHLVNGHTLDEFKQTVAALGFSIERLVENQGFGVAWLRNDSAI